MKFTYLTATILPVMLLASCGGSTSAPDTPSQAVAANTPSSTAAKTEISGQVTYDRVPLTLNSALDYANTRVEPIRGAVIEAVDGTGKPLATGILDDDGRYKLSVDANTDVRIRIKSQLLASDGDQWNFSVTDNTQNNQIYALEGSLANTGQNSRQTRDLHAPHGWTGESYGRQRSAAPFAILDSVYKAVQSFSEVDTDIKFPPLELRWSTENKTLFGDKALGFIGTSAYFPEIDGGTIYILGEEDRDTDEYDEHVIIHEWGHYFEHQLSRTDSLGGLHSLNDRLDPRVAYSEGWSNALSAIITGDPIYRDSSGTAQGNGFSFDIESVHVTNPGWFSEASVGAIIYDIFDDTSDQNDRISAGLAPIYNAMRSPSYLEAPVFSTIFALADEIRKDGSVNPEALTTLLDGQSITGEGPNGSGERNSGAISTSLPVYKETRLNGGVVELCSVDDAGLHNKLGNREFIFLSLQSETKATLSLVKSTGDEDRDPDFNIWQGNQLFASAFSSEKGQEVFQDTLPAGDYVIEAFDFFNINGTGAKRGDGCYRFTVTG